jgi:hypothetical protein
VVSRSASDVTICPGGVVELLDSSQNESPNTSFHGRGQTPVKDPRFCLQPRKIKDMEPKTREALVFSAQI